MTPPESVLEAAIFCLPILQFATLCTSGCPANVQNGPYSETLVKWSIFQFLNMPLFELFSRDS